MDQGNICSRKLLDDAINLRKPERTPVGVHWWGVYKYEATGRDSLTCAWQDGAQLTEVYSAFYEEFRPDWFHLHIGTPRYFRGSQIVERDGKNYLEIDPSLHDLKRVDRYFSVDSGAEEEIVDFPDYILSSRAARPKVNLSSRAAIDEFFDKYIHMDSSAIRTLGYTDHVEDIVRRFDKEVFIAVHIPSAVCEILDPTTGYVGFEEGLMAFIDYPKGMQYLLERSYEEQLNWARAYAKAGAHAFIISESYISPDLANPNIYKNFLKDIHVDYFAEIARMGLIPMCMFWGDINPILEDLTEINIKGLLVEESKKGYDLNIAHISRQVKDRVCLFGNVDSIQLLHDGSPAQVRAAVRDQIESVEGSFVVSNGSPLTPGTPKENVLAMIDEAKKGV